MGGAARRQSGVVGVRGRRDPGTSVTYYKPKNSNQLLAKRISDKDDPRIPMTGAEFLAKAWKLANNKAREVGWIKARGWA